jgi:ATP-dependent helicase IRC3
VRLVLALARQRQRQRHASATPAPRQRHASANTSEVPQYGVGSGCKCAREFGDRGAAPRAALRAKRAKRAHRAPRHQHPMLAALGVRPRSARVRLALVRCTATASASADGSSGGALALRDYQRDCLRAIHDALGRGVRRPAAVLATGGGKTVVFSHLIGQLGGRALVLAHKQELVHQAAATIRRVNPHLLVDIDMHRLTPRRHADVVVALVPTLVRMTRLLQYRRGEFGVVVLDECHHATAASWLKIVGHVAAPLTPVVGFTATMERADGTSLGTMFDEIVYERALGEMVALRELADVRFTTLDAEVDFSGVRTRRADFDPLQLSAIMNTDRVNGVVAAAYLRLRHQFGFRSTLVFCVDVAHCRTLCAVLQRHGVNAQYVTGDTVAHERAAILADFKQRRIAVLCNVLVFTEGTDIPNVDLLILARPTRLRPLLVQMVGRGLRLAEGKTHCHVVDVAGVRAVGLQLVATLLGAPGAAAAPPRPSERSTDPRAEDHRLRERLAEEARRQAEVAFSTIDGFAALVAGEAPRDDGAAFSQSRLHWVRLEYNVWGVATAPGEFLTVTRLEVFTLRLMAFTLAAQRRAAHHKCPKVRVLGEIMADAQLLAVLARAELMSRLGWRHAPKPTAKQLAYLRAKLGAKAQTLYEWSGELEAKLAQGLAQWTGARASRAIFAYRYSVNSLWVRWELQRLVGYSERDRRRMERASKRASKRASERVREAKPSLGD